MLSSARTFQFEPRLPSSSRSDRTHITSRSSSSNYIQASTSRLPTSPPKQLPSIPSCISPSSVFYQVLTAPCRQTLPAVSQRNPVDSRHTEARRNPIDRTRETSSSTIHDQTATTNATTTVQARQIYTPHGCWAWADGLTVNDTEELMQLECKPSVEFPEFRVYMFLRCQPEQCVLPPSREALSDRVRLLTSANGMY